MQQGCSGIGLGRTVSQRRVQARTFSLSKDSSKPISKSKKSTPSSDSFSRSC